MARFCCVCVYARARACLLFVHLSVGSPRRTCRTYECLRLPVWICQYARVCVRACGMCGRRHAFVLISHQMPKPDRKAADIIPLSVCHSNMRGPDRKATDMNESFVCRRQHAKEDKAADAYMNPAEHSVPHDEGRHSMCNNHNSTFLRDLLSELCREPVQLRAFGERLVYVTHHYHVRSLCVRYPCDRSPCLVRSALQKVTMGMRPPSF